MSGIGSWYRRFGLHFAKLSHNNYVISLSAFTTTATTNDPGDNDSNGDRRGLPPIRVGFTESAGRGVFATRRIMAGDLIHTDKPAVCHPSLAAIDSVCYLCLRKINKSTNLEATGMFMPFCSQGCEQRSKDFCDADMRADWTAFVDYCRIQALKYPLLVKRLACMVISGAARSDSLDILQPASLNPAMMLEMEQGFQLLRDAFEKAHVTEESIAFLTKQWYISVLSRIRINAFRIELIGGLYEDLFSSAVASIEAEAAVGNAVYILSSLYNHDCDPNAHIVWIDNAHARLKALRDVNSDEELRICYIDASMDRDARQRLLFQGFGFQCKCDRCLNGD